MSQETSPTFVVGGYVLVARVRHSGSTPKLLMMWTGPWRVVMAEQQGVYGMENIVLGEVRDVHVTRVRFYLALLSLITAELKELIDRQSQYS